MRKKWKVNLISNLGIFPTQQRLSMIEKREWIYYEIKRWKENQNIFTFNEFENKFSWTFLAHSNLFLAVSRPNVNKKVFNAK